MAADPREEVLQRMASERGLPQNVVAQIRNRLSEAHSEYDLIRLINQIQAAEKLRAQLQNSTSFWRRVQAIAGKAIRAIGDGLSYSQEFATRTATAIGNGAKHGGEVVLNHAARGATWVRILASQSIATRKGSFSRFQTLQVAAVSETQQPTASSISILHTVDIGPEAAGKLVKRLQDGERLSAAEGEALARHIRLTAQHGVDSHEDFVAIAVVRQHEVAYHEEGLP
jgi:hypothetical protein